MYSSPLSIVKVAPGPKDLSQTLEDWPKQPKLVCYPKTKFDDRMRYFSSNWYTMYKMDGSVFDDSVFCFPCCCFSKINDKSVFISVSYNNWKNTLAKTGGLKKHVMSSKHQTSIWFGCLI